LTIPSGRVARQVYLIHFSEIFFMAQDCSREVLPEVGPNGHPLGYNSEGDLVEWFPNPENAGEVTAKVVQRSLKAIRKAYREVIDKEWYKDWWYTLGSLQQSPKSDAELLDGTAAQAARRIEKKYGTENLERDDCEVDCPDGDQDNEDDNCDGSQDVYEDEYKRGFNHGREDGYEQGYEDGYEQAYQHSSRYEDGLFWGRSTALAWVLGKEWDYPPFAGLRLDDLGVTET
jgi:hypothetical protein